MKTSADMQRETARMARRIATKNEIPSEDELRRWAAEFMEANSYSDCPGARKVTK